ncbi:hypothetical protein HY972_03065 [Candidatus Kaiserbacteria bacterium]|nr:hypothetical protein [Candidatus Kaiserbacteria bacterium]
MGRTERSRESGRAWKGTTRHDTITVCGEFLHIEDIGGGRTMARLLDGAIAVMCGNAHVIDDANVPIEPETIVICPKEVLNGSVEKFRFRVGVPIEAIDPGEGHSSYVLPWSTLVAPTIAKSRCRSVGPCNDANIRCGNCCNNPKKR